MSDYALIRKEMANMAVTDAGVTVTQVGQYFNLAELMQRANMLPKGVNPEGAVIAMIHGASVGLRPFAAVQGIAVVNGRPTVWGDALLAIVKASGLLEDEKLERLAGAGDDQQGYRYTVKRKGIPTPYSATFTVGRAKKAGLWGKAGPWQTNPDRMIKIRARAFAIRDAFADVLQGLTCREEEEDAIVERDITPEVVVSEPVPAAAPAAPVQVEAPAKKPNKLLAATRRRSAQIAEVQPSLPKEEPVEAAVEPVEASQPPAGTVTAPKAAEAPEKAKEPDGQFDGVPF